MVVSRKSTPARRVRGSHAKPPTKRRRLQLKPLTGVSLLAMDGGCYADDGIADEPPPIDPEVAYLEFARRFQRVVGKSIASGAVVAIVSKGDPTILELEGRTTWHFPRSEDGSYTGYYPGDCDAAIGHLESLRRQGAEYLVFPQHSFWWLDHYSKFRAHLESNYALIARDDDSCLIYALSGEPRKQNAKPLSLRGLIRSDEVEAETPRQPISGHLLNGSARPVRGIEELVEPQYVSDLFTLFDGWHYAQQAGEFPSVNEALIHYLQAGYRQGYYPHPLFDPAYYSRRYLGVEVAGINPLLHFVVHGVRGQQDPNPLFDTEYYYNQSPGLRAAGINALVHYITNVGQRLACQPNPLFRSEYYFDTYPDIERGALNPLAHYLAFGFVEGRFVSHLHKELVESLAGGPFPRIERGQWQSGTTIFFADGERREEAMRAVRISEALSSTYHVSCPIVFLRLRNVASAELQNAKYVVLEDHQLRCDVLRDSAQRLLIKTLAGRWPFTAISSTPRVVESLNVIGVPSMLLCDERLAASPKAVLEASLPRSARVVFNSSDSFHAAARTLGKYPTNSSLLPYAEENVHGYAYSLLELGVRDGCVPERICTVPETRKATSTRKVFIPCCDWWVSGVNSALEAIGKELIRRGWNAEILFTRDRETIAKTTVGGGHLPEIPYSYLDRRLPGTEGLWQSLVAHLENNGPCIMLMAYDFAANSVAPALSDKVGVVAWSQSDDNDYYEQTYRLGPYCNAVVCVSGHIKSVVAGLNPAVGARAEVIHNSSILERQIVPRKPSRSRRLRLIYTGRLVQYQKRILDVLDLAAGLDKTGVHYTISLIGRFVPHEKTEEVFLAKAHAHLRDGRIKLCGRMKQAEVFDELSKSDFFVLLSEFEGLPLSVVEAMAHGCVPVVAEMDSGIPELVQHGKTGFLVEGRDYDDWARKLVQWWRDPKCLAQMSQDAQETVRAQFTVEHVGGQFSELLSRIAAEICSGKYVRPACLNWGRHRASIGDVLLPPSMYSHLVQLPGLRSRQ